MSDDTIATTPAKRLLADFFRNLSEDDALAAMKDIEFCGSAFVMMQADGSATRIDPAKVMIQSDHLIAVAKARPQRFMSAKVMDPNKW